MNKLKVIAPALEDLLRTKVHFCINHKCPHYNIINDGCSLKRINIDKDGQCFQYKQAQQTKEEK